MLRIADVNRFEQAYGIIAYAWNVGGTTGAECRLSSLAANAAWGGSFFMRLCSLTLASVLKGKDAYAND